MEIEVRRKVGQPETVEITVTRQQHGPRLDNRPLIVADAGGRQLGILSLKEGGFEWRGQDPVLRGLLNAVGKRNLLYEILAKEERRARLARLASQYRFSPNGDGTVTVFLRVSRGKKKKSDGKKKQSSSKISKEGVLRNGLPVRILQANADAEGHEGLWALVTELAELKTR